MLGRPGQVPQEACFCETRFPWDGFGFHPRNEMRHGVECSSSVIMYLEVRIKGCVCERERDLGVVRHTLRTECPFWNRVHEFIHALNFITLELAPLTPDMQIGGDCVPMSRTSVLFSAHSASLGWHLTEPAGFLSPSQHSPKPWGAGLGVCTKTPATQLWLTPCQGPCRAQGSGPRLCH